MKSDAEGNETYPAIAFDRFHSSAFSKKNVQCCPRDNINREVGKESTTDMESATSEKATVAVSPAICLKIDET